jgi:hypothetical protein
VSISKSASCWAPARGGRSSGQNCGSVTGWWCRAAPTRTTEPARAAAAIDAVWRRQQAGDQQIGRAEGISSHPPRRAARPLRERLASITPPIRIAPTIGEPVARMTHVGARYGVADVLHDVDEVSGIVSVELVGACGTCPASTQTLKAGIERIMRDRVDGVTEVVNVAEAAA